MHMAREDPWVRAGAPRGAATEANSDRQKQVDRAIDHAFRGKVHKGKCQARIPMKGYLTFHHYQHTLLVYDLGRGRALMTWHEKPTDKRILRAALANLEARCRAGRVGA